MQLLGCLFGLLLPLGLAAASTAPTDQAGRRLLQSEAGGCNSDCHVRIGTRQRTYCQCIVAGKGNMEVFWDLPRADNSSMDIAFASARKGRGEQPAGPTQYLALAFPEVPGRMVPADAVVVRLDEGLTDGASGAQYYLAGYLPSSVSLEANAEIDGLTTTAILPGMSCAFTVYASGNVKLRGARLPIIVAGGLLDADGQLMFHRFNGNANLALRPGVRSLMDGVPVVQRAAEEEEADGAQAEEADGAQAEEADGAQAEEAVVAETQEADGAEAEAADGAEAEEAPNEKKQKKEK